MKPTRSGKLILFLLSYYPLFALIVYNNDSLKEFAIGGYPLQYMILIFLTFFVLLLTYIIFYHKKWPKKVFEITDFENISAETLNYLVMYIVGLFFVDGPILSIDIFVLLILFYVVYQAGGTYYLQPILMAIGFKVYKCKIDNNNTIMIISDKKIINKKIEAEELVGDIYIYRGEENE